MVALFIAPRVGMVLAGRALASHAGWDLVHYRRNAVVPRSLAEFCMLLDVPLGSALVVLAFHRMPRGLRQADRRRVDLACATQDEAPGGADGDHGGHRGSSP